MKFITETVQVKTTKKNEMINVTSYVDRLIKNNHIMNGLVVLFVPHTTAAITINENADPDVKKDMMVGLSRISPILRDFEHCEGNSDAHIKSSLIGVDQTIIVRNKDLLLGTWQGIYFCEFDGPRTRKLHIRIMYKD